MAGREEYLPPLGLGLGTFTIGLLLVLFADAPSMHSLYWQFRRTSLFRSPDEFVRFAARRAKVIGGVFVIGGGMLLYIGIRNLLGAGG